MPTHESVQPFASRRFAVAYRDEDDGMREVYLVCASQFGSDLYWVREREDALDLSWGACASLLCSLGLGDEAYLVEV